MSRKPPDAASPLSFEKALERLESIVAEMETGQLSLDKMIARFEEGNQLVQHCTRTLNEVEKKVEQLVRKGDAVVAEPFTPESGPEPETGRG